MQKIMFGLMGASTFHALRSEYCFGSFCGEKCGVENHYVFICPVNIGLFGICTQRVTLRTL